MADYWSSFQLDGRGLSGNMHGDSSHQSAGLRPYPCRLTQALCFYYADLQNMMSLNTTHARDCANSLVDPIILWAVMFLFFHCGYFWLRPSCCACGDITATQNKSTEAEREDLIRVIGNILGEQNATMVHCGNCRIHLRGRTSSRDDGMLFLCLGF